MGNGTWDDLFDVPLILFGKEQAHRHVYTALPQTQLLYTTSLNRDTLQVLVYPVHRLGKVSGTQRHSWAGAPAVEDGGRGGRRTAAALVYELEHGEGSGGRDRKGYSAYDQLCFVL